MESYYIRPIPLSKGFRDRSQWTYRIGYGQKVASCCYVWYIEGHKKRVLIDAGVNAEEFKKKGIYDEDIQSLDDGLKKLEIGFGDIDIVILTHLHWDHLVFASKFKRASFFLQKEEFDFAMNPHRAVAHQYNKELFMNLNLELIEGDTEIIDGVKVFLTPGHTPGGQSVGIETPQGLAVITGFCCTMENFFPITEASSKGFSVVAPGIHTDMLKAYDSVIRVKELADIIIALHDPRFSKQDRIP